MKTGPTRVGSGLVLNAITGVVDCTFSYTCLNYHLKAAHERRKGSFSRTPHGEMDQWIATGIVGGLASVPFWYLSRHIIARNLQNLATYFKSAHIRKLYHSDRKLRTIMLLLGSPFLTGAILYGDRRNAEELFSPIHGAFLSLFIGFASFTHFVVNFQSRRKKMPTFPHSVVFSRVLLFLFAATALPEILLTYQKDRYLGQSFKDSNGTTN